jgi:hypothetical protein
MSNSSRRRICALGVGYLPALVHVAKHESHDVAGNIRALEGIWNSPYKLDKAYL